MSGQTWTMNSMNVKSTRPKQTYTIVNKETLKQTNTKINWTLESIYQQNNQPSEKRREKRITPDSRLCWRITLQSLQHSHASAKQKKD